MMRFFSTFYPNRELLARIFLERKVVHSLNLIFFRQPSAHLLILEFYTGSCAHLLVHADYHRAHINGNAFQYLLSLFNYCPCGFLVHFSLFFFFEMSACKCFCRWFLLKGQISISNDSHSRPIYIHECKRLMKWGV